MGSGASWGAARRERAPRPFGKLVKETSQDQRLCVLGLLGNCRGPPSAPGRRFLPSPSQPLPHLARLAPAPPPPPAGFQRRLARHGHGHSATRSCEAHRVEKAGSRVWAGTEEKFSEAEPTRVREGGAGRRERKGKGRGT